MKETIKQWIKEQKTYHLADMSYVRPEIRYCDKDRAVYLNSCAGLIKFTSRDRYEFQVFRNTYANQFNQLADRKYPPVSRKEFFALYKKMMKRKWSKEARIKWTANLRTRVRMKFAS